jgi:hypothetical protein
MMIYTRKLPRGQDVRDRARIRSELPPAAIAHPLQEGPVWRPRGRPAKNIAALLAAALNETVTVTENGKRRQVTKRGAVIAQLVDKSVSADLRATKMLIDMLTDIKKSGALIDRKIAVRSDRQTSGPTAGRQAPPQHVRRLSPGGSSRWPGANGRRVTDR